MKKVITFLLVSPVHDAHTSLPISYYHLHKRMPPSMWFIYVYVRYTTYLIFSGKVRSTSDADITQFSSIMHKRLIF